MNLRWFAMCDENGRKTSAVLQYWEENSCLWVDIPYVECKTWEEDNYLMTEHIW